MHRAPHHILTHMTLWMTPSSPALVYHCWACVGKAREAVKGGGGGEGGGVSLFAGLFRDGLKDAMKHSFGIHDRCDPAVCKHHPLEAATEHTLERVVEFKKPGGLELAVLRKPEDLLVLQVHANDNGAPSLCQTAHCMAYTGTYLIATSPATSFKFKNQIERQDISTGSIQHDVSRV